ncbi:hypothetical protein [Vibrio sagamiensis]|uniref:hypothetical protein n=1 Tax=Vibrio sagamiensis TaxID=512650 RepID=UPI000A023DFE|nr:hypothetical protein [Vibrio sagamiensis]PNQ64890.1 hypothetical protein C1141_09605 [Vibrio agarivorans]
MAKHVQSTKKQDSVRKGFLWLIIIDYLLLAFFLFQLSSLTLNNGAIISFLLVVYNFLLVSLCFQRTHQQESYIIYPILSATLLAFICFIYFFFWI